MKTSDVGTRFVLVPYTGALLLRCPMVTSKKVVAFHGVCACSCPSRKRIVWRAGRCAFSLVSTADFSCTRSMRCTIRHEGHVFFLPRTRTMCKAIKKGMSQDRSEIKIYCIICVLIQYGDLFRVDVLQPVEL